MRQGSKNIKIVCKAKFEPETSQIRGNNTKSSAAVVLKKNTFRTDKVLHKLHISNLNNRGSQATLFENVSSKASDKLRQNRRS